VTLIENHKFRKDHTIIQMFQHIFFPEYRRIAASNVDLSELYHVMKSCFTVIF